jgi:hypothetical protein
LQRPFETFIGIDLGGARGRTTAVTLLRRDPDPGTTAVVVHEVGTRSPDGEPWHDAALERYLAHHPAALVAINGPLTVPACVRCQLAQCPGKQACSDPAVVWLRELGHPLAMRAVENDRDRIAMVPGGAGGARTRPWWHHKSRVEPYVHRGCEVHLHYRRGVLHRDGMGMATGAIAARAVHLRRRLASLGFRLDHNLLEVSARVTIRSLFGEREARGYRRDADPWRIRARIVEELGDLRFARSSRMAREEVLRNDHGFDSLVSGYSGYLWARDGWRRPDDAPCAEDGWIWSPADAE